jgi:hypothetical protein
MKHKQVVRLVAVVAIAAGMATVVSGRASAAVKTPPPVEPPVDVVVLRSGETALTVSWSPPTSGAPITAYEVAAIGSPTVPLIVTLPTPTLSYTFDQLRIGKAYRFVVVALRVQRRSAAASSPEIVLTDRTAGTVVWPPGGRPRSRAAQIIVLPSVVGGSQSVGPGSTVPSSAFPRLLPNVLPPENVAVKPNGSLLVVSWTSGTDRRSVVVDYVGDLTGTIGEDSGSMAFSMNTAWIDHVFKVHALKNSRESETVTVSYSSPPTTQAPTTTGIPTTSGIPTTVQTTTAICAPAGVAGQPGSTKSTSKKSTSKKSTRKRSTTKSTKSTIKPCA